MRKNNIFTKAGNPAKTTLNRQIMIVLLYVGILSDTSESVGSRLGLKISIVSYFDIHSGPGKHCY